MSTIQADFDRLALLAGDEWNHNNHYHSFLLKHVPSDCREALEIGCGTGSFSRLLATRCDRVLALDLSPQMIRIARERSGRFHDIGFQVADIMSYELPAGRFDCIVTVATLHHLPLAEMLLKMKDALRFGGRLLVLDLFRGETLADAVTGALAIPAHFGLKLIRLGRLRDTRELREAWAEHDRHDSYPSLTQVRRACREILPGAEVRRHLLWRYSIIWRKAEGDQPGGQVIARPPSTWT
jgi:SAM-dependent methyltransferase